MGETKHTPGPRYWNDSYCGLYGQSETVLHYEPYEGLWIEDWTERGRADANLIAAAPELLEALKAVISENHVDGAFDMARAAIAKAEGKA